MVLSLIERPAPSRRIATPERWQAALKRAMLAGVQVRQLESSGAWIVTSASNPIGAHETDGQTCSCQAAMLGGDPVCLHRAAFWHAQGVLELDPEPDPEPAAAMTSSPEWIAYQEAHQELTHWQARHAEALATAKTHADWCQVGRLFSAMIGADKRVKATLEALDRAFPDVEVVQLQALAA